MGFDYLKGGKEAFVEHKPSTDFAPVQWGGPADCRNEPAAMRMEARRSGSIGTLTGWQLLAEQVVAATSSAAAAGRGGAATAAVARGSITAGARTISSASGNSDSLPPPSPLHSLSSRAGSRLAHQISFGASSSGDDPGTPTRHVCPVSVSAPNIAPRPHQSLYKEYKLLEEIGAGGFGRVIKARRLCDGRLVVVKEIKTSALSPKQRAAAWDEVEALAALEHPNIVRYHDVFTDAAYMNIVMEYADGGDLAGLLRARRGAPLAEPDVMSLFVQVALALRHVHAAGVLHRDLKPSNVLATRGGLLKLGDFGVAKLGGNDASLASTVVGTPHYLSPEMCDNKPYGRKSDVWALGCILVELATLNKAFEGNSISKIILAVMRGQYRPIPETYSAGLRNLAARLLQVDPAERPSVAEVLAMPYVRRHLARYVEWARRVPEARLDVFLSSLQGPLAERGRSGEACGACGGGAGACVCGAAAAAAVAAAAAPAGGVKRTSSVTSPQPPPLSVVAEAPSAVEEGCEDAVVSGASNRAGGGGNSRAACAMSSPAAAVPVSPFAAHAGVAPPLDANNGSVSSGGGAFGGALRKPARVAVTPAEEQADALRKLRNFKARLQLNTASASCDGRGSAGAAVYAQSLEIALASSGSGGAAAAAAMATSLGLMQVADA